MTRRPEASDMYGGPPPLPVGYRIPIRLSPEDVARVELHARRVEATATRRGWHNKWSTSGMDIVSLKARGFGAELAVALVTGLEWHPVILNTGYSSARKLPDVGRRVEVRSSGYELWSRPNDRDDWVYVHVSGSLHGGYTVNGWIEGVEFRTPEHWRQGRFGRPSGYMVTLVELRALPLPDDA